MIVVTGGAGFIGSALVHELNQKGIEDIWVVDDIDHSEKQNLFKLLQATEETGISLTESFAMQPAASVSGWYFANKESQYFGVGKIGLDQVKSIAESREQSMEDTKKHLRPNLD